MAKDLTTPDPSVVLDLLEAFRRSKAMFAAVSLGVFEALAVSPKSLSDLAQQIQANPDALGRLLDACVGLQLLDKRDDQYENTPVATAYLSKTSPHRLTGYITYSNDVLWKLWGNLEDAVREGTHRWKQTFGLEGDIFSHFFRSEEAKQEFLMGMHGQGVISSPHVVAAFDLSRFRRLVDLGGATGHLAMAACGRWPELRAVIFELPEALPLARKSSGRPRWSIGSSSWRGTSSSTRCPRATCTPWAVSYTIGPRRRACGCWAGFTTASEGRRRADRREAAPRRQDRPRLGADANLNMLVCTEGKERTLAEYGAILKRVGFGEVLGRRTNSPLDAVLAFKA